MVSDTNRSRGSRPSRCRSTSIGKSRLGRQSPYQLGLNPAAPAEQLDEGQLDAHVRGRHARPGRACRRGRGRRTPARRPSGCRRPRCRHRRRCRRCAARTASTGSVGRRVDDVGGTELPGPLELPRVEVDGDDRGRAGELGARDGGVADAAAAEDRHAVARGRPRRCSSAAPSPAMTPHPSRPATSGRAAGSTLVHWPAATRVFSANAPMPRAGVSGCPSRVICWAALWVEKQYQGRPRRHDRHCPHTARQLRIDEVAGPRPRRPPPRPTRPRPAASWPRRNGNSSLMPPSR